MKLIISLRSSLLIVSVLTLCLRAKAFAVIRQGRKSSPLLNKQLFIKASTSPSISSATAFDGRHFSSHSNEDVSRGITIAKKLMSEPIQLLKTMLMVSIISIGSIFVTDVASVSATSIDHLNGKQTDCTIPTFLLAKGAYVPEAGYDTLDFSMPSYRVDADIAEPIKVGDMMGGSTTGSIGNEGRTSATAKKSSSSSSPNRAEKGALAVAQAKAKKEAAKADALAKQQALKEKAYVKSEATID